MKKRLDSGLGLAAFHQTSTEVLAIDKVAMQMAQAALRRINIERRPDDNACDKKHLMDKRLDKGT